MAEINGIDYSTWANKQLAQIAQSVDKDGVKGLQGKEKSVEGKEKLISERK